MTRAEAKSKTLVIVESWERRKVRFLVSDGALILGGDAHHMPQQLLDILVGVQPMAVPSSALFYMDYQRGRKPRWFWNFVDKLKWFVRNIEL